MRARVTVRVRHLFESAAVADSGEVAVAEDLREVVRVRIGVVVRVRIRVRARVRVT